MKSETRINKVHHIFKKGNSHTTVY